ncbi:hypothetical protein GCM10027280_32960 [Micromonospora polyrhachis]|uniref:Transcriptional regulator with XRE-family HTH domain n=1 Tax=Micromonospora polyrhachis TaxID=1282883 RepID=A0A7W7SU49_9ACTN|nr:transcriptional regulator with XRE-family HTH domain [Micromonospora polyrhachis]
MSRTSPDRIRELRLLAGLSQRDLAERVNELARQQGLRTTAASADTVVAERVPFTADAISELLTGGRLAPAGAGCVELAWRHREQLLS